MHRAQEGDDWSPAFNNKWHRNRETQMLFDEILSKRNYIAKWLTRRRQRLNGVIEKKKVSFK